MACHSSSQRIESKPGQKASANTVRPESEIAYGHTENVRVLRADQARENKAPLAPTLFVSIRVCSRPSENVSTLTSSAGTSVFSCFEYMVYSKKYDRVARHVTANGGRYAEASNMAGRGGGRLCGGELLALGIPTL